MTEIIVSYGRFAGGTARRPMPSWYDYSLGHRYYHGFWHSYVVMPSVGADYHLNWTRDAKASARMIAGMKGGKP